MFWTQSHFCTCTHNPFPNCFVALRPTLKKKCIIFLVQLRLDSDWNAVCESLSFPCINWKVVTVELKSGVGKNSRVMLNGRSHCNKSQLTYLGSIRSQSFMGLCLWFSIAEIFCFSHTLAQSQTVYSQSALCNLWSCYPCYTIAHCSVQKYRLIPLTGLFQNISNLRQLVNGNEARKTGK